MKVWVLHDYGVDEYGPCRRVSWLELTEREVVIMLNHYRNPNDVPRITYFLKEGDARHALAMLGVKK